MEQIPKRLKRLIREWAGVAHNRELSRALLELRGHFDRRQRGEITPSELNALVHAYHDGAALEIWKHYATNRLEPAIGFCVAAGILRRDELPSELCDHVARWIEIYESEASAS